jgi:CBS domain-containing protein
VVVLGSCRSQADTGTDLIYELDDQVHTCQIKLLKYLHHGLSRTLATPVRSWQVERRPAPEPTAGEVMTPLASLTTLAPATTVHQAVEEMLQASAHAMPVCDEDQLVGVVTLADLARRIQDSRGVLSIERVQTVVHSAATVGMTAPLSMVRALMARELTGLIAVTGPGGMIVGCITAQSLLADEAGTGNSDTGRPEQPSTLVPLLRPGGGTVKVCMPV